MRAIFILALLVAVSGCAGGNRPLQLVASSGAVYPPQARQQGVEGYVSVRYDVDVDGRVQNARVAESSPPGVFDESAVQAVSRWRFKPPERHGEPQPVTGLVSRLQFTLEGSDRYDQY